MKLIFVAAKYLKKYPILAAAVLCLIIIVSLFEGASLGMLVPLIQSMTQESDTFLEKIPFMDRLGPQFLSATRVEIISLIFVLMLLLLLAKNICMYLSSVLIEKLRFGVIRDLRVTLMDNLLEYDIKYFDEAKMGHILNNLNMEVQRIGDFLKAVLMFVAFSGRILAYIVLLFLISWKASIVVFLLTAGVIAPLELIMAKIKKIGRQVSQAAAEFNYKLLEILGGIRLIKGSGTEDMEKKKFKAAVEGFQHFQYKKNKYSYLIAPLSETLIFGLIVLCFLLLINVIKIDIAAIFPLVATFLLVLARALTQLNSLNNMRSAAMANLAACESYEKMSDEKGKKTIKDGSKKIKMFSDSIEFKNVSFSYTDGKQVLEDISIKIPKGKITALVGASGAGKSTLVNLIARFYESRSVRVLVDGIDLKDLLLKDWRRKIGFVSQDVFIFNTSVKDNMSYGHADVDEEEVVKASRVANAHDFIMNLPNEYDTILGERGVKLSGGQKQRISIARAIIHNPEILILDEATSSLDTETEKLITAAIDRLTKNRTVIAIAHRLSTILHADNIIVLDKGRIIEEGKHADLFRKNGLYKKLCDAQFNMHNHAMEAPR